MAEKNIEKIAEDIKGLNALELSELAKHLEDVFGVTAAPMMMAGPAAGAPAGEAEEEKTNFDVVLTDGGAKEAGATKIAVIKAVRELKPDLGLMDAKKLVESAPQTILTQAKKEEAQAAKAKLEEAGAKVELK